MGKIRKKILTRHAVRNLSAKRVNCRYSIVSRILRICFETLISRDFVSKNAGRAAIPEQRWKRKGEGRGGCILVIVQSSADHKKAENLGATRRLNKCHVVTSCKTQGKGRTVTFFFFKKENAASF